MISRRLWLLGLCAAMGLGLPGCSQEKARQNGAPKVLRIGSDVTFPPMEFVGADGEPTGFDVDLARAVALRMGREARIENIAWGGIFGALQNGNVDVIVSSVTITDERQRTYLFCDPYLDAGQVLIVRKGDVDRYKTLGDLNGKKVGAQVSTTGAIRLKDEPGLGEVSQYDSIGLAFIDLVNGGIDAVMVDKPVAEYYATKKPESAGKMAIVGEMYTQEKFGFVVQKKDAELAAEINRALASLRQNGDYDKIYARWFQEAGATP